MNGPHPKKGGIAGTLSGGLAVALLVGAMQTAVAKPYHVPSGSMEPTLRVGDFMVVSKWPYGYSRFSLPFSPDVGEGRLFGRAPQRGDVVVFRPTNKDDAWVKRVVGLPGDVVQVTHARLFINGSLVPRTRVGDTEVTGHDGSMASYPAYEETLPGGVKHRIVQVQGDDGPLSDTRPYVVPEGQYFMMGDDRDDSLDSRVPVTAGGPGFVPEANLIGRAEVVLASLRPDPNPWAFWRWPVDLRWDRFVRRVG